MVIHSLGWDSGHHIYPPGLNSEVQTESSELAQVQLHVAELGGKSKLYEDWHKQKSSPALPSMAVTSHTWLSKSTRIRTNKIKNSISPIILSTFQVLNSC